VAGAIAQLPYRLDAVASAAQGWQAVARGEADLLLLDLDLPSLERLGWFKLLRQTGAGKDVAAVLASARRDEEEVAEAFEHDADDFVAKDCAGAELCARLKTVLRRRTAGRRRAPQPMRVGAVSLDASRHRCLVRSSLVELNPREFRLLEALMSKAGRVLSRDYLLETVWGMSREARTRAVDVSVSRLRRALGKRAGRWIETVESYGYRFRDPRSLTR
jgi:DNA-binding response OmpR family regulator